MRAELDSHGAAAADRSLRPEVTSMDVLDGIRQGFVVADVFVQPLSCNKSDNGFYETRAGCSI